MLNHLGLLPFLRLSSLLSHQHTSYFPIAPFHCSPFPSSPFSLPIYSAMPPALLSLPHSLPPVRCLSPSLFSIAVFTSVTLPLPLFPVPHTHICSPFSLLPSLSSLALNHLLILRGIYLNFFLSLSSSSPPPPVPSLRFPFHFPSLIYHFLSCWCKQCVVTVYYHVRH